MVQNYNKLGFRKGKIVLAKSQREVLILEYKDEPGVFYINWGGRQNSHRVSGPFRFDDPRFQHE